MYREKDENQRLRQQQKRGGDEDKLIAKNVDLPIGKRLLSVNKIKVSLLLLIHRTITASSHNDIAYQKD
jgi:hypothetical protein